MQMPELPDIVILTRSMNQALSNRTIIKSKVHQPKVLNCSVQTFRRAVKGRKFNVFQQRGKWVLTELDNDYILAFNLGMGGEIRLHKSEEVYDPKRERVVFFLDNRDQVWIHFWWFGYVHLIKPGELLLHPQLGNIGPDPLNVEFTVERLTTMLDKKRGRIKSYLLNQRFIAGIGNVYIQDILWYARLHPDRKANTITTEDVSRLHQAIRHVLEEGIRWGGGPGEQDIYGNKGTYADHFQVGYRTGKSCPVCKTTVEELRVGNTMSYICPYCQI